MLGEGGLPAAAARVPFAAQLPLAGRKRDGWRARGCRWPCCRAAHEARVLGPVLLCSSRCGARLHVQVMAAAAGPCGQAPVSSQRLLQGTGGARKDGCSASSTCTDCAAFAMGTCHCTCLVVKGIQAR